MRAVCRECGVEKDGSEFRKNHRQGPMEAWNFRHCKACAHAYYLARRNDPAKYSALMESSRAWKENNPERHAELAREYRRRHPDQVIAQNRLNYAIRKGRVVRLPCEVCGTDDRVHAHHKSYKPEDWYNVRWLCYVCHKLEHTPQN